MEHPQLVKFLGAGEIYDDRFNQEVLFIVQEYVTGGSINNALWNTPLDSLTWDTRLQWASDIAEGTEPELSLPIRWTVQISSPCSSCDTLPSRVHQAWPSSTTGDTPIAI